MRAPLVALLLAGPLAGCQCFVPVDDGASADAGALSDAGGPECGVAGDCAGTAPACDAARLSDCRCGLVRRCQAGRCLAVDHACPGPVDGGGGCAVPSDCAGSALPVISACGTATGAWSCAFGRCVVECAPGRTCQRPDAGCLDCEGVTVCAPALGCPLLTHLSFEGATCPQFDTTEWLRTVRLGEPNCSASLLFGDGGVAGQVTFVSDDDVMADLPDVGGGCVGRRLPGGALRFALSCPGCMMSARPEIVGP